MPQALGRLHYYNDLRLETEIDQIYTAIQRQRLGPENMDLPRLAGGLGQVFKDGEIEALNRLFTGMTFGKVINLAQERPNHYTLYAIKQAGPTAPFAAVFFSNETDTTEVCRMEQQNTGVVLHLKGRLGANPVIKLEEGGGGGDIITSVTGAKLSAAGVWTDAPCTMEHKAEAEILPSGEVLEKLSEIPVWRYRHKSENGKTPAPPKHLSPNLEDLKRLFGVGDGCSLAAKDVASLALRAVQALQEKVGELEAKLESAMRRLDAIH